MKNEDKKKKMSIAKFVKKCFEKNLKITTSQLISLVEEKYPESKFDKAHVLYYRSKLRKEGMEIPYRKTITEKKKNQKT